MEDLSYLKDGILLRRKVKTKIIEEDGERYATEEEEIYEWHFDEMSSFKWTIIQKVFSPLKRVLEPKGFQVIPELDIKYGINPRTGAALMVTPDVSIFKGLEGDYLNFDFTLDIVDRRIVPVCIFESVSASNPEKDYVRNKELYRGLGIKEYVILDYVTGKPAISVYRLEGDAYVEVSSSEDGRYELKTLGIEMKYEPALVLVRFYEGGMGLLTDEELIRAKEDELIRAKEELIRAKENELRKKDEEIMKRDEDLRKKEEEMRKKEEEIGRLREEMREIKERDKGLWEMLKGKDQQYVELVKQCLKFKE